MEKEQTVRDIEYGKRKRISRREVFLDTRNKNHAENVSAPDMVQPRVGRKREGNALRKHTRHNNHRGTDVNKERCKES
jgi:hypothetical protein